MEEMGEMERGNEWDWRDGRGETVAGGRGGETKKTDGMKWKGEIGDRKNTVETRRLGRHGGDE